jgi:hypothetical protein
MRALLPSRHADSLEQVVCLVDCGKRKAGL